MSLISSITNFNLDTREKINNELTIKIENKFQNGPARYIFPFILQGDDLILPFAYASSLKIPRPKRDQFSPINLEFNGHLRPDQQQVKKEALKYLSKIGSVMISAYPGFGKTCGAINLATSINFKTLIIVNKIVLIKQWKESIIKFCPNSKIQIINPKDKFDSDVEFYIINAQNVEKMKLEYFKDIGTLIVDEAHLIMAETLSRSMQYITPRYLIGLSATPYRPDGLNILLDIYFGTHKIIRKLYKEHTVYKVETGFKPIIEKTITGRLNWGSILDQQAKNDFRNNLIVHIVINNPERNFLILIKRVEQGVHLMRKLNEQGQDVTDLIGNKQEFNTNSRILIGTCQKVGVGFDHPKLDTLLLATDIEEYFVQYLGRIFRTKDNEPVIYDLIDNNPTLLKHFNTRKKIYEEHGGKIKILKI